MLEGFKKLLPDSLLKWLRPYYHGLLAWDASWYFERPSEKLIVIGITGTAGKSTTAAMLAHILNGSGRRCGFITTVSFSDGRQVFLNKHGLSMPSGTKLQKQLRTMVDRGCRYAVVECTSEGLAQNRHLGINFDVALFTNLSRAHLESHGGYGNYQAAKSKLFAATARGHIKTFFPQKMIGVNFDDAMPGYFLNFPVAKKFGVTFRNIQVPDISKVYHARTVADGGLSRFMVEGEAFSLDMLGDFNAQNGSLAAAAAEMLGVGLPQAAAALGNFHGVRGRMERVPNERGLTIVVDYGCEPASFRAALEAASIVPRNRLIHVFGSTGGHRDKQKRFEFGQTSAQFAGLIVVTNDDIYDSDPAEIARNIEAGIQTNKLRKPLYEIVLDRRAAIARALAVAVPGDLVLITGKGSEQFLVLPGNKRIEWDEVSVVKEELNKIANS